MDEKKEIILKLENICQSYVVGNDVKDAVDNVSLEVYDNEFLVVLGPGHCGKTVLMNTIAGIEKPIGGKIFLFGDFQSIVVHILIGCLNQIIHCICVTGLCPGDQCIQLFIFHN